MAHIDVEIWRGRSEGMSKNEAILINYIINKIHSCPIDDEADIDFEKECVGLGEVGCGECILRNIDKLEG